MKFPTRFVRIDEARRRHGDRVERFGALFGEGDPLADAVVAELSSLPRAEREALVDRCLARGLEREAELPSSLAALFRELDHVPFWVDFARIERGAEVVLRAGLLAGLVLGSYSLVAGYCSPAGNKPLAFSGRLEEDAPRRLAETSRFVEAVIARGGMRRHAPGFACTVKVRLVHASVRRMLERSPRWHAADWGVPINQVDMAGTILLFSHVLLDGLTRLGFDTSREEREDVLHLWRYVAYLIGVKDELRCATEAEAASLWDLLTATQAPPDEDSRSLAKALLDSQVQSARTPEARAHAERMRPVGYTVSRYLLGDDLADRLGYPSAPMVLALPLLAGAHREVTRRARKLHLVRGRMVDAGRRYWREVVELSLAGEPATFAMPEGLRKGGAP
ncbi:MAG: DUF2236 domain-containing protein [Deltaproteobacteria bacterium]|nr:DUF2236 domain-containing protein [Deltaproteobacteria bacterium]